MPRQTRSQSRSQSRDVSPELVELDFSRGKPTVKKTVAKKTAPKKTRRTTRGKQAAAAKAVEPPSSPTPTPTPLPPRETTPPREATPPAASPTPPPPSPPPTMLPVVPEESPQLTPTRNSPFQSIFSKVSDSVKSFLFRSPLGDRAAPSPTPDTPTPTEKMDIPSLHDIVLPDKPEYHETPRTHRTLTTPRTAPVRRINRTKTPKTVPARKPCPAVTEIPDLKDVPGIKTPSAWWYDRAKGIAPNGRVVQPHTQRYFQKKIKEYDEAVVEFEKSQAVEKEAQLVAEEEATQQAQNQVIAELQAGKDEGKRVHDDSDKYATRIKNGIKEIHVPEDMLKSLPPISNPTGGGYGMDLDYFDDEEDEMIWVTQEFWAQNRVDAAPPNKKRRLADRYPDRVKPADYTDGDWELVLKYGTHPDPEKQNTFGVPEYDDEDTTMLSNFSDDAADQSDISMMSAASTAGKPAGRGQRADGLSGPSSAPAAGFSNIFNMTPAKTTTPAEAVPAAEQTENPNGKDQRASPPPPPRPAHAQLPKNPETPSRSSLDPVARQRHEAEKYKPVQSSRLREVSAATPSSMASASPGSVPVTPTAFFSQEPVILSDDVVPNGGLESPLQMLPIKWPAPKLTSWATAGLTKKEEEEVRAAVASVPQEEVIKRGASWFSAYVSAQGFNAALTA